MQVTRAKVTDVDDPEGLGRVRLMLPPPRSQSGWTDVASPAAGTGPRLGAAPAVGDTALVAAVDRRGRDLVVMGFLWTAAERPAGSASLRTRDGLSVTLDSAGDRLLLSYASGTQLVIGGGATITITADRVTIDAAILEASGTVKCDALIANNVVASSYSPGSGNIM
ncbi:phage baseplate assembly protein gpV [Sphingobium sp. B2D3A]|uniref:phage baseplate assembly protein V n=1 Tax=unclassified Sphingobium TaxID=2611147 RepID=UPI002225A7D0|nr:MULTISPECIES: phage baseplate assembly protein V [unclassified Sphingobium]MCW2338860.1 phage baseplate assembly protein gpV [Sphingobium sp. B2D3A]MCW2385286.1 phage baseplate assembly protein gpV [Sphingobium sp. B2D3D]